MAPGYGDVMYTLNDNQLQSSNAWGSTAAPGIDGSLPLGVAFTTVTGKILHAQGGLYNLYYPLTPKQLSMGKEIVANQIILSNDWTKFTEYYVMLIIHSLKKKDKVIKSLLNENDRLKFWSLVDTRVLNKTPGVSFEIHNNDEISLSDVKSITISSKIQDMLIKSCPADYDTYKDKIIIDNNVKTQK